MLTDGVDLGFERLLRPNDGARQAGRLSDGSAGGSAGRRVYEGTGVAVSAREAGGTGHVWSLTTDEAPASSRGKK